MSVDSANDTRIYRGRTVAELLPRIRAELGADAIVVRQREGLAGGLGGFFQHPFVEIEARANTAGRVDAPRVDVRDDSDARPQAFVPDPAPTADATAEGLRAPAIRELLAQAAPFAEQLGAAIGEPARPEPPPVEPAPAADPPSVEPAPAAEPLLPPAPPAAGRLEQKLVDAGLPRALAADVVAETVQHLLPFGTPRQLKRLVRGALARRIPVAPAAAGPRRTLAVVGGGGSGKTLSVARLAAAYAAGAELPVAVVAVGAGRSAAELAVHLDEHGIPVHPARDAASARRYVGALGPRGVAVVDTPRVSPGSPEAIAELAGTLSALALDEIHVALPATLSRVAAEELVDALAPLGVSRLLITHADETAHLGPVVGLAVDRELPVSYVGSGGYVPGGLAPADPDELARRLLP